MEETRFDVGFHVFWKQIMINIFDIHIANLGVGYYLHVTPEKELANSKRENKYK